MIQSNRRREIVHVIARYRVLARGVVALACVFLAVSCTLRHAQTKVAHSKIRVGDWADYDIVGGLKQKKTVIAIEGTTVVLLVETRTDQNILRTGVERTPLDAFVFQPAKQSSTFGSKSGEEDVIINDRTFRCAVFDSQEGDLLVRRWFSSDAPLDGLVQMARRDDVILRLHSFGKAEK
jgi:hypothetical protein